MLLSLSVLVLVAALTSASAGPVQQMLLVEVTSGTSVNRLYLPSTGAAAVSPAFSGSWGRTADGDRIAAVITKINSAMTNQAANVPSGSNYAVLGRQYVSAPLAAQTISGTVKSQVRAYDVTNTNEDHLRLLIRVCSNDGSTFRGTVLSLGDYGSGTTLANTIKNRKFANSGTALTSLAVNAGDRLVIEYGVYGGSSAATDYLNFGDNSGTDLPEDETTTSAYNPWIEFSNALVFQ